MHRNESFFLMKNMKLKAFRLKFSFPVKILLIVFIIQAVRSVSDVRRSFR